MAGLPVTDRKNLLNDLWIGFVIALLSIPLSMGYAQVAGLPPQYGLYGSLFPVLIFGLITTSPRMVLGVDAAPAALVGTLLAHLGIAKGSAAATAAVPMITLLSAIWLFLFWALRGGRFARFIAEPVLGGCVTGIASIVILTQLPQLFGGATTSGRAPTLLLHLYHELNVFHPLSFLLGTATVAAILLGRKHSRSSVSVISMIVGILLSAVFHLDRYGVALLGTLPSGIPEPAFHSTSTLAGHESDILIDTLAIALVIASETLVSTREIGHKYEDRIDNQRELLAYAASNIAAALFGSSPVSGSISRTNRANHLGVKSQWMSVAAFAVTGTVLLFAVPLLRYLPVPILTGIAVASLITMLEFSMAAHLWKIDRPRCFIFLAAFAAEMLGLAEGVLVGVVLSFASFTMYASMQPREFLGCLEGEPGFFPLSQTMHAMPLKDTLLYQFSGELFFANIDDFIDDLDRAMHPSIRLIVVSGLTSVDLVSAERLLELYHKLKKQNVAFFLAGHNSTVNKQLICYGAGELIHEGVVKHRYAQALAAGGLTPPYPLDASDVIPGIGGSGALEEFTWTYGSLAGDRLEQLAKRVSSEVIATGGTINRSSLSQAERDVIGEYWSSADGKSHHELMLLADAAREGDSEAAGRFRGLAEELLSHRFLLERQLIYRGDVAVARELVRMRVHLDDSLFQKYPDMRGPLDAAQAACLSALHEEDPDVADILREFAEECRQDTLKKKEAAKKKPNRH